MPLERVRREPEVVNAFLSFFLKSAEGLRRKRIQRGRRTSTVLLERCFALPTMLRGELVEVNLAGEVSVHFSPEFMEPRLRDIFAENLCVH